MPHTDPHFRLGEYGQDCICGCDECNEWQDGGNWGFCICPDCLCADLPTHATEVLIPNADK